MNSESETIPYTKNQIAAREKNSRRFWVCLICSFFAMDFTIAAIAISMAAGDPSFRAIPGYGERAVAWDIRQERNALSKQLGWKVEVERVEPHRDAIDLKIVDSDGKPVQGCTGSLRLFHFTRVADQRSSPLKEIEPGRYRAIVDVAMLGRWHLDIEMVEGERKYWEERTLNWLDAPEKGSRE